MKKVKINIFSFLLFFVFVFLSPSKTVIYFICVCLHELGHVAAMLICKEKPKSITVYPVGFDIKRYGNVIPYRKEIFIFSGGIAANVFFAAVCYFIFGKSNDFFTGNCLFAAVNLIPISGFDGWNALRIFLQNKSEYEKADKILRCVELTALIFVWITGVLLFFYSGWNMSLLLIFFFSVFSVLKSNVNNR